MSILSNWPTTLATGIQPGTRIITRKTGLVEATSSFILTKAAYDSISASLPRIAHPLYSYLIQDGDIEAVLDASNRVTLSNVIFRGSQSDLEFNGDEESAQIGAPTVYELGATTAEEPIYTNHAYDGLTSADKLEVKVAYETLQDGANPAAYAEWSAAKQALWDKLAEYGRADATWRAPRDTWTVRYNSLVNINESIMRRRGTITRPWGPAPKLGDNRNWLFDAAVSVQTGASWDITLTWLASGPGGWDADHYAFPRTPIT